MIPIPQYPLYSACLTEHNMDQVRLSIHYGSGQYTIWFRSVHNMDQVRELVHNMNQVRHSTQYGSGQTIST